MLFYSVNATKHTAGVLVGSYDAEALRLDFGDDFRPSGICHDQNIRVDVDFAEFVSVLAPEDARLE